MREHQENLRTHLIGHSIQPRFQRINLYTLRGIQSSVHFWPVRPFGPTRPFVPISRKMRLMLFINTVNIESLFATIQRSILQEYYLKKNGYLFIFLGFDAYIATTRYKLFQANFIWYFSFAYRHTLLRGRLEMHSDIRITSAIHKYRLYFVMNEPEFLSFAWKYTTFSIRFINLARITYTTIYIVHTSSIRGKKKLKPMKMTDFDAYLVKIEIRIDIEYKGIIKKSTKVCHSIFSLEWKLIKISLRSRRYSVLQF